ncbi:MAG: NAD-dependent epimerase/dehydratase [Candidatus Moranbacteria bacterium GW2011_GWC2_37_73]|nr:MAG: NAD-dependent epimerase/dehydratase [Candidatus Moranbacteria bacterium GW2011_GWC2_37_73]
MQILVTGGAGFIGSNVTKKLLFNDYYSPKIKELNVAQFADNPNFTLYRGSITDYEFLKTVFEKENIQRVVHAAARAGVRPSIENPFIYEDTNVKGTLNLLHLAKEFKIENFVLFSSSSVYGNSSKVPFSENEVVDCPISPYAATKKATELLGYTYHHLYHLNVNVVRPFTVYGPGGRPDMFPFLATKLIDEGLEVKRFGDGSTRRDYTFIDDLVDGVVAALDTILGYEIFNLGNSNTVELNYFISTVEKILGKNANIKEYPMQPGDVLITNADLTKSRKLLGYNPKVKIEEGMSIFIKWYQENKNLY